MKVLITGANGFVGVATANAMRQDQRFSVRTAMRSSPASPRPGDDIALIGNLDGVTDWNGALNGVDVVIHLAARVHQVNDTHSDPLAAYRSVNAEGTLNLARQAAAAGVRRFVFLSSIKVNGEQTGQGQPFRATDMPAPQDPYGISKLEAEQGLHELSAATRMEVVIIRPPLVYGPGVKANFLAMMRWLQRGVPLPLGSIDNVRSLVAVDNLVDLLCVCTTHPAAAGQVFLVSDDDDVSTTELLTRMSRALRKPARLLPVPPVLLRSAAALIGRNAIADRLLGSLQLDIQHTKQILGWTPPSTMHAELQKTAESFLNETNN